MRLSAGRTGCCRDDAVEMIAQHIITVPVFDALFGDFEFAKSNPVSVAIDGFLTTLSEHRIEEASDAEVLEDVYASVRRRAAAVRSDVARQQLIRDLYERFFKVAFSDVSDKMGVVYVFGNGFLDILAARFRQSGKRTADVSDFCLPEHQGLVHPLARAVELDESSMVDHPVDHRGGKLVVAQDRSPFAELDVGGEHHASLLVAC